MTRAPHVLALDAPQDEVGARPRVRQDGPAGETMRALPVADAEWLSLEALTGFADQWQALAARALEPNIFYEPGFALPAARAFGAGVGAVAVWADATRAQLIGLFPSRFAHQFFGLGPLLLAGWTHPYAPLGTPLVDREHGASAVAALLAFLADGPRMPRLVLLPYMTTDGPVAALMQEALQSRGGCAASFDQRARALLAPSRDHAGYLEQTISPKKRKELRRQRRLLGEDVRFAVAIEPRDVKAGLDRFLALERQGWKGRRGTAAALDPVAARFMQDAVANLAQCRQAQVVELLAGGRAVAAGIVLRSGDRAWFWKIAYDETVARASPGVQLTVDFTRACLDDPSLESVDSCATPDHAMIDHIWRERLELADMLIAVDARASGGFALARALERLRRSLFTFAKALRNRLLRR